ncbi:MAG: hypothetical protein KGQ59_11155, partial [Bdellovibrionales bacterium]|nr:hypothetical protein [Bdellovibrionales bacterium]
LSDIQAFEAANDSGFCSEEQITASPFAGSGTAEDPYVICTVTQLDRVRDFTSSHFVLAVNLNLNGAAFMPIPNFKGTFDGNGKMISNLVISMPLSSYVGFFAKLSGATVKDLLLDSVNVEGDAYVGGLAGRVAHASVVSRVFVTGSVTGTVPAGGLAGQVTHSRMEGSVADVVRIDYGVSSAFDQVGECSLYCSKSSTVVVEAPRTPSLCSNDTPFDGGLGTRSNPFLISNAQQMQNLHCNPAASFRLTSNIDLSGVSYEPIEDYSGVFDGGGHTIANLLISLPDKIKVGLFNSMIGGVVKDLVMQDATVTGGYGVAAVAGWVESGSVILRCRGSGSVNVVSSSQVGWGPGGGGGIVGYGANSIVAESSSSVTVVAGHRSGGLVGQGEPEMVIWDSYSTGEVYCDSMCGRLAGVMAWNSTVINSYSISSSSGGQTLVSYMSGTQSGSALNPSVSATSSWDPAIWLIQDGFYPGLR